MILESLRRRWAVYRSLKEGKEFPFSLIYTNSGVQIVLGSRIAFEITGDCLGKEDKDILYRAKLKFRSRCIDNKGETDMYRVINSKSLLEEGKTIKFYTLSVKTEEYGNFGLLITNLSDSQWFIQEITPATLQGDVMSNGKSK